MPDNPFNTFNQFQQLVMNPNTREIRAGTPEEYKDLPDTWKQTSPSIEQLQEAYGSTPEGGIDYSKDESGRIKSSVAPTVAAKNMPTTPEGNIDLNKSIEIWGDNAANVVERAVADQDKQRVRDTIARIQQPSGQYVWNPQTEEIRFLKDSDEVRRLFEEG